jgi:hypothetical protein
LVVPIVIFPVVSPVVSVAITPTVVFINGNGMIAGLNVVQNNSVVVVFLVDAAININLHIL